MQSPHHFLFICSANLKRSKTAEDHFALKYPDLEFQSAGTNLNYCLQAGSNPITQDLVDWADYLVFMEEKHRKKTRHLNINISGKHAKVLHIEDRFDYGQSDLLVLLEEKMRPILQ